MYREGLEVFRISEGLEDFPLESWAEVNFAFSRFDAKLEQRLAQFDAKWEQWLVRLEMKLEAQGRMLLKWMVGLWMATVTTLGGLIVALQHFGRP